MKIINFQKWKNENKDRKKKCDTDFINNFHDDFLVKKKWSDYTLEEKKHYVISNKLFMKDYIEYASMQRYSRQFDETIIVLTYELWISRQIDKGFI